MYAIEVKGVDNDNWPLGVAEPSKLDTNALLTVLGYRLKPKDYDLLDRLRRSGWVYGSLHELHTLPASMEGEWQGVYQTIFHHEKIGIGADSSATLSLGRTIPAR